MTDWKNRELHLVHCAASAHAWLPSARLRHSSVDSPCAKQVDVASHVDGFLVQVLVAYHRATSRSLHAETIGFTALTIVSLVEETDEHRYHDADG